MVYNVTLVRYAIVGELIHLGFAIFHEFFKIGTGRVMDSLLKKSKNT